MAVRVKLPTILRPHAGGVAVVESEGSSLGEVLKELESRFPGITRNVVTDAANGDGFWALHRFVNVYVNGEDVRYTGVLQTRVSDGDTVSILPAVAGG